MTVENERQVSGNRIVIALVLGLVPAAAACPALADFTKPWKELDANGGANWISLKTIDMYAANRPDTSYPVSFNTVSGGKASGMTALMFADKTDAHHQSTYQTGSVDVLATGKKAFTTVLVLIAIKATSLPGDFGLTLNGYTCDPATYFVYYDGTAYAAGRPSGYYPDATDPEGEQIAYDFQSGMVTVLAFPEITLAEGSNYTLNYSFDNLPAKAVFSVYAMPDGEPIHHTNRGLPENGSAVSTFEVLPEPASLALLACGFAALHRRRRR